MKSEKNHRITGINILTDDEVKRFERIYLAFYPRLMFYACEFVPKEEAEDIIHNLFVKLWPGGSDRKDIVQDDKLFAYMLRAVHNDCVNHIKRKQMMQRNAETMLRLLLLDYASGFNDRLSGADGWEELECVMNSAIDGLPEKCREIFRMSRLPGVGNRDIAAAMNISVRTVEAHISKALRILRAKLKRYYEENM